MNTLSLIVPAYNEARTIEALLTKVIAFDGRGYAKEIIVVDDASQDNTSALAEALLSTHAGPALRFQVLRNPQNLGKSQTVKRGILASTGELVVVQDADLEYEPADLSEFLELFQKHDLDFVYGNRFGLNNKVIYWKNWFGNRFLTLISNLFTMWRGLWVSDMEVCYKMLRGDLARQLAQELVSTSNFGFEPEITARLARAGARRYRQVPVHYFPRTVAEGKHMKAVHDGWLALQEILRFNLR